MDRCGTTGYGRGTPIARQGARLRSPDILARGTSSLGIMPGYSRCRDFLRIELPILAALMVMLARFSGLVHGRWPLIASAVLALAPVFSFGRFVLVQTFRPGSGARPTSSR